MTTRHSLTLPMHISRKRQTKPTLKERASVAQSASLQHRKNVPITMKPMPWKKGVNNAQ